MNDVANAIGTWAMNQGIGVCLLLFAVYWLDKQNKKARDEVRVALDAASIERNSKYDNMRQSMDHLDKRIAECETDRRSLWNQLVDLAKKQAP